MSHNYNMFIKCAPNAISFMPYIFTVEENFMKMSHSCFTFSRFKRGSQSAGYGRNNYENVSQL
jgi:hypothetical protein